MQNVLKKEEMQKYIFFALALLLIVVSYYIIKPYIVALISAFVLAFLLRPVHSRLAKIVGEKISALVCIFALIFIIILPLAFIIGALLKDVYYYASTNDLQVFLNTFFDKLGLDVNSELINSLGKEGLNLLISLLKPLISNFVSWLIALFVMLFGLYYILLKWDYLSEELENFIPFKDKKTISKELSSSTKEIVYGTFLIGILEFIIAAAGFYFLGVKSYLLFATLIFFSALIPMFGSWMVWLPLSIYYFFIGNNFSAVGIILLGLIISVPIDMVLRNIITGKKHNINPFIMFIGVFGGVSLFGIFGFIIGPLLLVYAIRFVQEIIKD